MPFRLLLMIAVLSLTGIAQAIELRGCPEEMRFAECSHHSGAGLSKQNQAYWMKSSVGNSYLEVKCTNDPGRDRIYIKSRWHRVNVGKYTKLSKRCSYVFRASGADRLSVMTDAEYRLKQ